MKIERENQTLATITFQNYFRMYDKLSGMTGTADTEAVEFDKIYKLEVVVDPDEPAADPQGESRPRLPDREGEVRRGRRGDRRVPGAGPAGARRHRVDREVGAALRPAQAQGREARRAQRASYHEQEAEIVAQAGRLGAVTIATNMAGRGTDILLGGNPEFLARQKLLAKEIEPADAPDELPRSARSRRRGARRVRGAREGRRARRAAHHRHRAARGAPDRQPAPRPRGPPGRSGLLALLPLARGRPDADLRRRAAEGPHGAPRHRRGRADRVAARLALDRAARRSRSSSATSRPASTFSSTTT